MSRAARDETGAVRLVVNSRDVTEQRGLQEQLRQAQRMELMGQLAGGIAHDFNNLLTVIIGRSELLRQRLAKDDSARRNIELIQDAASRGAALTQQLPPRADGRCSSRGFST
jgi:signal transduction histidine kinase